MNGNLQIGLEQTKAHNEVDFATIFSLINCKMTALVSYANVYHTFLLGFFFVVFKAFRTCEVGNLHSSLLLQSLELQDLSLISDPSSKCQVSTL